MRILKGKNYKSIHTRDIFLEDLRAIFFPKNFREKYHYLGAVPWEESGRTFEALLPLVLTMDYYAKRWWTPRWLLGLLHLFGNDNSIVRIRNFTLHNWHRKLTNGILFVDYKVKWTDYDLRITVYGPQDIHTLADSIESQFWQKGRREFLLGELDSNPQIYNKYEYSKWDTLFRLESIYKEVTDANEKNI